MLFLRCGNLCTRTCRRESFDSLQLVCGYLVKEVGLQLKQGCIAVRRCIEDLAVVRGKIDMPGTIRNRLAHHDHRLPAILTSSRKTICLIRSKVSCLAAARNRDVSTQYKIALKRELLSLPGH